MVNRGEEKVTVHMNVVPYVPLLSLRRDSPSKIDEIFRFEIPGIPCDEWNSIFRFLGLTRPRSMAIRFQVWRENTKSNGGLFYPCLLAFRLLDRRR